jgi:serine phosphatase RsbU (regulator of sigma subunit)
LTQTTAELDYAGAMNHPLYYVQQDVLHEIKATKLPIGGEAIEKTFELHTIALTEPTTIYLCSDGYQDQFGGEKKKKFMVRKFRELLLEISTQEIQQQSVILRQTIEEFMAAGNEKQVDDITILGLKVN